MSFQGNFNTQHGSYSGAHQPSGLSRQGWNQLVASNAAQAASSLDPFYRSQRENHGLSYPTRSNSLSTIRGAANYYDGIQTPSRGNYSSQNLVMTPTQLGATVTNGQIRGLDREGYQVLISQVSNRFGINASDAARLLGPYIQSQKEARALRTEEWSRMLSDATRLFGVNTSQAAVLLDPYVRDNSSGLVSSSSAGRSSRRSRQNLNEVDIARIAQALGIQTHGLNRGATIAAIKNYTGNLSPRSQGQFFGSQSPRSQQSLGTL